MANFIIAFGLLVIYVTLYTAACKLIEWHDKKYGVDRPMPGDDNYLE